MYNFFPTNTTGPSIFNFRKVAREHEINDPITSCKCVQSPFLYHPLGHVITGDLRIIPDKKLRNLSLKDVILGSKIILIGILAINFVLKA